MKMYVEGTNKWTKVSIRVWKGHSYSEDFSNDILFDVKDGGEYTEEEISAVLEWCEEYCEEYGCNLDVEEGED